MGYCNRCPLGSWEGASTLNLCRVLHYRLVSSAELACTLAHTKTGATILLPNLVPPPGPMCSLGLFSCRHYLCTKTGVESGFSLRCSGPPFPFLGKDPWGRLWARASHPSHATATARALLQKRCGQKPDSEDWHLAGVLGTGQQPQYTDGAWVSNPASLCWNWGYWEQYGDSKDYKKLTSNISKARTLV